MEPIPELFKGKVVCKCCIKKPLIPTQNIHLIIEEKAEKAEKRKLIINKGTSSR